MRIIFIKSISFVLLVIFSMALGNAAQLQMTESVKIEYLIQSVEKLDGAQFYRNGTWYGSKEAGSHLRLKLKNAGGRIKTARQFIDNIATKSSMSGLPYKIKLKVGKIVESKVFFYQQLNRIE